MTRTSIVILAAATLTAAYLTIPTATAEASSAASPVIDTVVIGHSLQHRPITAYRMGNPASPIKAVLLGQMHGDEHAGVTIATDLLRSRSVVTGIDLWVIPTINPDGNHANTRQNARGVDLNRNWPNAWVHTTTPCYRGPDPLERASGCNSGYKPLSEPETAAMYRFLQHIRPRYLVSLHQPLDGVDTTDGGARDPAFRNRLATDLHLPKKAFTCWGSCHGSMTGWITHHQSGAAITVELPAAPHAAAVTSFGAAIVRAMTGTLVIPAPRAPVRGAVAPLLAARFPTAAHVHSSNS